MEKPELNEDSEDVLEDCWHQCTSGCQKDFDCPCVADHLCKNSPEIVAEREKNNP